MVNTITEVIIQYRTVNTFIDICTQKRQNTCPQSNSKDIVLVNMRRFSKKTWLLKQFNTQKTAKRMKTNSTAAVDKFNKSVEKNIEDTKFKSALVSNRVLQKSDN